MIKINGDIGGGQVLRTALGLSALTSKPFEIEKIRETRSEPGLKPQHLECVNATARLCDAEVEGNKLNSKYLRFMPQQIKSNRIDVRIPTAGSVSLVLQCLLLAGTLGKLTIKIEGGATYTKWAPPMDYMENVLFRLLSKYGYDIEVKSLKDGFYPKGGALVEVVTSRAKLKPIEITDKGNIVSINGISVASTTLEKARVAERQAMAARKVLFENFPDIDIKLKALYRDSICMGSGITLWTEFSNSIISGDCLGEKGKSSESVGREAAISLLKEIDATVDSFTADQLIPYMAIMGEGKIITSRITPHIIANSKVSEMFLPVKFKIKDKTIKCVMVS